MSSAVSGRSSDFSGRHGAFSHGRCFRRNDVLSGLASILPVLGRGLLFLRFFSGGPKTTRLWPFDLLLFLAPIRPFRKQGRFIDDIGEGTCWHQTYPGDKILEKEKFPWRFPLGFSSRFYRFRPFPVVLDENSPASGHSPTPKQQIGIAIGLFVDPNFFPCMRFHRAITGPPCVCWKA